MRETAMGLNYFLSAAKESSKESCACAAGGYAAPLGAHGDPCSSDRLERITRSNGGGGRHPWRPETSAIILASFGSADDTIRAKIFDALTTELAENFPAFEIRQAFTSNFMIRKLSRRGIFIATPAEEIARLRDEGCRKIFLLPTHLTAGEEFDNKIAPCAAEDVTIIPPLMSEPVDPKIFATVLDCFPCDDEEDLVLVGHGSPNRHNPVYESLQRLAGAKVHIGVIEPNDTPNFADVLKRLKLSRAEKILLAPLLLNGGVHVAEDIAGDENSWLSRLTALGYRVRVIGDGLGTFASFRKLYVDKFREATNFGRAQI